MNIENIIKEKLYANFPDAVFDLKGDGHHFTLVIKSEKFKDRSMIDQHRMIYQALGDIVGNAVHALSLKTSAL